MTDDKREEVVSKAIEFSLAVPTMVTQDIETTAPFCSFQHGAGFVHFAVSSLEPRPHRQGWNEQGKPADTCFVVVNVKALYEEYVGRDVDIQSAPKEQS